MADARQPLPHAATDASADAPRHRLRVSRRTFLKGVGAGVVAVGLSSHRTPVAAGAAASPSPSASPPIDLADATETWVEPVVWRPDGAQQLVQQVVTDTNGFR